MISQRFHYLDSYLFSLLSVAIYYIYIICAHYIFYVRQLLIKCLRTDFYELTEVNLIAALSCH